MNSRPLWRRVSSFLIFSSFFFYPLARRTFAKIAISGSRIVEFLVVLSKIHKFFKLRNDYCSRSSTLDSDTSDLNNLLIRILSRLVFTFFTSHYFSFQRFLSRVHLCVSNNGLSDSFFLLFFLSFK